MRQGLLLEKGLSLYALSLPAWARRVIVDLLTPSRSAACAVVSVPGGSVTGCLRSCASCASNAQYITVRFSCQRELVF